MSGEYKRENCTLESCTSSAKTYNITAMAAVTQLVLLLCLCGTLADQSSARNNPNVTAERDVVTEQKEELKATKAALDTQRTLVSDLRTENSALGTFTAPVRGAF